ncbi:MAG TPA: PilZ domain-containing protein [Candidatus Omnitrophota bacterium]|nr:PilZ domain-containing protein [Candidatus Omnitrophota bacterium]HPN57167.1 PilZ domain-containing protein [Candidatus Omnitrophota bacterium]
MSHQFSGMDRRKYPRTQGNIPVKIYSDDFDVVTETKNLSRAGVYCQVDKYIEPMTKLNIHLLLSCKKDGKTQTKKISCQGVIVRTESVPGTDIFNVAIYFNEIKSRDAESIADFIETTLEKETESSDGR